MPFLKEKKVILLSETSLILNFDLFGLTCELIQFEGLFEESNGAPVLFPMKYKTQQIYFCSKFIDSKFEIKNISLNGEF